MQGADQYRLYLASAFSIDFSSLMIDTILVSFSSYCRSSVNTSDILSTGTTTTPVRSPTIQSPGRTSTPAQQSARPRLVQDLELTVRVIALIAFQDATQYGGGRRAHNLGLEDGLHVAIHEPSLSRGFIHRISDVAGARLGELDDDLLARRGAGGACGRGGLGAFVARKDDGSERGDAANGRQQNAMMHIPSCGESGFNLIEWTMNFKSKLR